ncbi:MAG: (d)CMP kinase [bacterium]
MQKIIIAIDGYSSTGKSTIAKTLASDLGYIYVDTGAMYRAATLFALQHDLINDQEFKKEALIERLPEIKLHFEYNSKKGFAEIYLNNENVEKEIRTLEVSRFVSKVAAIPNVRKLMVIQQHEFGKNRGLVMDGRDIGTVVFPDAELKLFMTASSEKRAQRRYDELMARGEDVTFEEVLHNVQERDYIDSHRKDSPLKKADDAIEIDNTELNLEEQYNKIKQLVSMTLEGLE